MAKATTSHKSDAKEVTDKRVAVIEGEFSVVRPLVDAEAALEQWNAYQELARRILQPDDYQTYMDNGQIKRFVKRSGWQKLATYFGLSVETIDTRIGHRHNKETCPRLIGIDDADCGCESVYARVVVRATAPHGRVAEGVGIPREVLEASAFDRALKETW